MSISKRRIPQGWLAFGLLAATFTYCLAEELILTTYYPSPRGVYQELRVSGNLGVGTMSPTATLDIRQDAAPADSATVNILSGASGNSQINLWTADEPSRNRIKSYPDRVSIGAGGQAEALHVKDNNVGIGTANPVAKLHVEGNEPHIRFTDTRGNRSWVLRNNFGPAANELLFMTSDDTSDAKVRFSTNGHVGIGTAPSNDGVLTVNSTSHYVPGLILTQSDDLSQPGPFFTFNRPSNPAVTWNMMVNDGSGALRWTNTLGAGNTMILDPNGNLSLAGTFQGSDARLKQDVETIGGALDKVTALRGVTFRWKDPSRGDAPQVGLIAQEVERVFPEAVKTESDGLKSVAYANLIAPVIEAIKEQQAEIERLQEKLAEIERP